MGIAFFEVKLKVFITLIYIKIFIDNHYVCTKYRNNNKTAYLKYNFP